MSTDAMTRDHSDTGRVVLGSLLYTAGSAIMYVLPAYLGELGTQLGINEAQMGSITAAENIGIGLASVLCILWLSRVNLRVLAVAGTVFCVALNLIAFFSRQFDVLMVSRFLTGLFGEGILFSLAFAVLGATRDPDRSFGIGLTAVVMFGSIVLGCSTYIDRVPYGTGAVLPLAIVPLGILFALRWMPQSGLSSVSPRPMTDGLSNGRLAILAVIGMAIWFAAPGAFWSFAESAAQARNVPASAISIALAIGNTAGLMGSVIAAWQGNRWGRLGPIVIATVCLCVSVVASGYCASSLSLALALSAFNVCWNYAAVYEMALVVALDPKGRVAPGISAAQVAGFAAGGFISGLAITGTGYSALPTAVCLFAVGGLLALAPCLRWPRRQQRSG